MSKRRSSFEELRSVIAKLRGPNGCPWDREQTHETLRPYLLEEAHEVADAISAGDPAKLAEELGDLLLHVFLHARLAEERGVFDVDDVAKLTVAKLRRRHPHVFGDAKVETPDEVRKTWERLKREEPEASATLDVPAGLSPLFRAKRVQERASAVGFDWSEVQGVLDKVREELAEVERALDVSDRTALANELGDLLFAVVNVSRFLETDPEEALRAAIDRFVDRFHTMERELGRAGTAVEDASLEQMDAAWERVKGDGSDGS